MTATFECKGLSKHFGSTQALEDVSFSIAPGRVVGLLGPNGSGKTTLIKLANGLLTPSEGEVLICGDHPGVESKAVVSYLPDKTCMPLWMNALQLMDFFQDFYQDFDRQRAENMLQRLGLELAAHQLHLAAVQLFHRAVALGQQVLPHQQLVDAVPHKGQGQGA